MVTRIIVTAIHTDSGKTLASAILCKALNAEYWKPVQAGSPYDSDAIRRLVPGVKIHPEVYLLETPESPHAAAKRQGIQIDLKKIHVPDTENAMVIEGAGGCLVPLNDRESIIDLILRIGYPVVLVSNFYLGSINHTLLSVEALTARKIPIKGIIFNGERNEESERIIRERTNLPVLLHIEKEEEVTAETVKKYAQRLPHNWRG